MIKEREKTKHSESRRDKVRCVNRVREMSLPEKKIFFEKKKIEKLESQKGGENIQGQGLLNPSRYYTGPLFETAKEKTKVKLFSIT